MNRTVVLFGYVTAYFVLVGVAVYAAIANWLFIAIVSALLAIMWLPLIKREYSRWLGGDA